MADDQIPEWIPEWKPEEQQEGIISKAKKLLQKVNTPLVDVSPQTREAMDSFSQEHPIIGGIGNLAVDAMTGSSSPLSLGLMGTASAAPIAAKAGLSGLAKALKVPSTIASGAAVAHGGYNAINEGLAGNYGKALGGVAEAGIGALGLKHGLKVTGNVPDVSAPIRTVDAIPVQEQLTLPPAKARLALPPAINEVTPPVRKPSFIAGPAGVAENRPYGVDTGPTNPRIGARNQGTVLPREFGQVTPIPPDLAAREGLSIGAGNPIKAGPVTKPVRVDPYLAGNRVTPSDHAIDLVENEGRDTRGNPIKPIKIESHQDVYDSRMWDKHELEEDLQDEMASKIPNIAGVRQIKQELAETDPLKNPLRKPEIYLDSKVSPVHDPNRDYAHPDSPIKNVLNIKDEKLAEANRPKIGNVGAPNQYPFTTPSAVKPKVVQAQVVNPLRNVGAGVKTITRPQGMQGITPPPTSTPQRPVVSVWKKPIDVVKDWANGRSSAFQYGRNAAKDFADLDDPSLIAKYQKGDRSGKLADVAQHLEDLRQSEVKAGVLEPDAIKANYLRQYWKESPAQVDKIFAGIVAKNPNFTKESVFKSYSQGIAAGLTPKFNTLPEILEARTAESVKAIKNKQFYDYLQGTGKLKPAATIPDTQSVDKLKNIFIDPEDHESKQFIKYMSNYLGDANPNIRKAADAASISKNIYLGGGVPGTKYNMHAWNTLKSDAKLRGFGTAVQDFVTDPTGKAAAKIWEDKGNRDQLAKFIEKGYTFHPVEDSGGAVNRFGDSTVGKAAGKVLDTTQKVFEKPLFDRALPATKFKGTQYAYEKFKSAGMDDDKAMRSAVRIGNEIYGGINKAVRDKTTSDLHRVFLLAPDWLESRVRLAVDDWKGIAKTAVGKGTAEDKLFAKSFARGTAITGVGALGAMATKNKTQDVTNPQIGTDAKGKERRIDMLGTADEGQRLPIQEALSAAQGNPGRIFDLVAGNKISLPARSAWNLATGKDSFGNAIRGQDKYGRQIPGNVSALKHLNEASKPFQYQGIQGFVDFIRDNASGEEALSKGLELPLKYVKGEKPKNSMSVGKLR